LSYFDFYDADDLLNVTSFGNANYAKTFGFNYLFNIDKTNKHLSNATVEIPKSGKLVKIEYFDYKSVAGHLMPHELRITMDDYEVTFTTNKITFGKKLNFPLTIPSSYKPFEF
jgi:hypothetical protein